MAALVYVLSLPIAVVTLASLLSVRDGSNGSWALVRALAYVLVLLLAVWATDISMLKWIGCAFATVVTLHITAFYAGRWFFTGIR